MLAVGARFSGTGFLGNAHVQIHICRFCQRRLCVAGEGDEFHAEAFNEWQDGYEFSRFTGIRQCQHHILASNHAHIAVAGFAGVHIKSRGAGTGECRRNLVGHMPGLAHAHHHYTPAAGEQQAAGLGEMLIQARGECVDGGRLGFQHLARKTEQVGGVDPVHQRSLAIAGQAVQAVMIHALRRVPARAHSGGFDQSGIMSLNISLPKRIQSCNPFGAYR